MTDFKKGQIRQHGNLLLKVLEVKGDIIELEFYELDLGKASIRHSFKTVNVFKTLAADNDFGLHFMVRDSFVMDEDSMQGVILAIFHETL